LDFAGNHRDRANTLQGQFNDLKINKMNEDYNNNNNEKDKDKDKKKIKLNVDSPKFTARAIPKNDNLTFNPLNSFGNNNNNPSGNSNSKNAFNKFDEFDPSA